MAGPTMPIVFMFKALMFKALMFKTLMPVPAMPSKTYAKSNGNEPRVVVRIIVII
jgi:hypothetical protein